VSLALAPLLLLLANGALPEARVAATVRPTPVLIDGRLDEPLWATARSFGDLHQRDPIEAAAPSERTEVLVAFDAEAVYVGARLFDSAAPQIVANLARRDREVYSDGFIVYLDPRHDRRTGFYFGVNAAGTRYDGTMSNDDWQDDSWDGVWEGASHVGPDGWTAELRIPLSQLHFGPGTPWGIDFERIIARKKEHDLLAYTPRGGSGFVSRFPTVEVPAALTPPRRLELLPYVSVRSDYLNHAAQSPLDSQRLPLVKLGGDLKLGLGGNLTLDATVYPDFGQVEVDPAVVNLSDLEVFFPERRPFFIEGADLLDNFGRGGARGNWDFNWPGAQLLYRRRIGRPPQGTIPDHDYADAPAATDIIGAAKLTGKQNGWSIGTLHAFTASEEARYLVGDVESRAKIEPFTYYGVARVQRELNGGRQGLGVMATVTARRIDDQALADQLNGNATVGGVDGWTLLGDSKMFALTAWAAGSRVQGTAARMTALQQNSAHYFQRPDAPHLHLDPTATHLGGWAGRVAVNKQHGAIMFNSAVGALSPGWEANDLGASAFGDLINAHVGGGYQWEYPGKVFRYAQVMTATFSNWDFGGNHVSQGYWLNASAQLLDYWGAHLSGGYSPSTLDGRATRGGPMMARPPGISLRGGIDSDDRRPWRFGGGIGTDRSELPGNTSWSTDGYAELRPSTRLTLRIEPSYGVRRSTLQYLDTLDDPAATATFGHRYLFGELHQRTLSANLRCNWIFTPTLSLEVFAQPLVSSVRYTRVLELPRPRTYQLAPTDVDPAPYSFTFSSIRSSAVLRWEYRPGSTVFLVWNENQSVNEDTNGYFMLRRSWNALGRTQADHVFMVKATYWWSP
jgi:hypothetical protein